MAATKDDTNATRDVRFVASLIPALLLMGGGLALAIFVGSRWSGFGGVLLGPAAAVCVVSGILLAYWTAVDWSNLRVLRSVAAGPGSLEHGRLTAFAGVVRVDGPPLSAPFTGTPCAAYVYELARSRASRSRDRRVRMVLAQGFHMMRTTIDDGRRRLRLLSLPSFEDGLRHQESGRAVAERARRLLDSLAEDSAASEREARGRLLEARRAVCEEVARDHRLAGFQGEDDSLNVVEEVLPAGREVCVLGTYDAEREGLLARRRRLGPDLMVYEGRPEDVLARVGGEVRWYLRVATVLLAVGCGLTALPFVLPA